LLPRMSTILWYVILRNLIISYSALRCQNNFIHLFYQRLKTLIRFSPTCGTSSILPRIIN
jgi:hypothetical protein